MMISSSETSSKTQRFNSEAKRKIKSCKKHLDQVRWRQSFKRFHLSQSRLKNQKNPLAKKARKIRRKSLMNLLRKKRKKLTKCLMRVTNLLKTIMEIPQKRQRRHQRRNQLKEQTFLQWIGLLTFPCSLIAPDIHMYPTQLWAAILLWISHTWKTRRKSKV